MNAPVRRDYRLHELSWQEFEHLCTQLCLSWLGEGFTPFAAGPDGGRDGKFEGEANCFPSEATPLVGKVVLQAKHTASPGASCSDPEFERLLRGEEEKIVRLINAGLCQHYLVFTNRKYTGGTDEKLIHMLKQLGLQSAHIVGEERLKAALDKSPTLREGLPNRLDVFPFRFQENDAALVVQAFHEFIDDEAHLEVFDSARDFDSISIRQKNKLNGLTDNYYEYVVVPNYMPHFEHLRRFLENPRNSAIAGRYHDAADELKQKLIIEWESFKSFDDLLADLVSQIQNSSPILQGKRRLVSILIHYMYCNCDIGKKS